ncbi:MAG TPA: hypothetical protein VNJ08_08535 [Bacteriovoracaceae bacterium]|nr:hypothetical protein [Bacteriovoracaceae bacterium]
MQNLIDVPLNVVPSASPVRLIKNNSWAHGEFSQELKDAMLAADGNEVSMESPANKAGLGLGFNNLVSQLMSSSNPLNASPAASTHEVVVRKDHKAGKSRLIAAAYPA